MVGIDCAETSQMQWRVVGQKVWSFVAVVVDDTVNEAVGMVTIEVDDMVTFLVADTVTVVDFDMVSLDSDSSMNCNPSPEIEAACIDRNTMAFCFCC